MLPTVKTTPCTVILKLYGVRRTLKGNKAFSITYLPHRAHVVCVYVILHSQCVGGPSCTLLHGHAPPRATDNTTVSYSGSPKPKSNDGGKGQQRRDVSQQSHVLHSHGPWDAERDGNAESQQIDNDSNRLLGRGKQYMSALKSQDNTLGQAYVIGISTSRDNTVRPVHQTNHLMGGGRAKRLCLFKRCHVKQFLVVKNAHLQVMCIYMYNTWCIYNVHRNVLH